MSYHLAARRRMIHQRGRAMVLRRQGTVPAAPLGLLTEDGTRIVSKAAAVGKLECSLVGFARDYRPEEVQGLVKQGDQRVEILDDEIAAAGWPTPPRHPDKLIIGGRMTTVQGAREVVVGGVRIGWSLWVTG